MTHTNDDEAMARLAALSAKLRSQDQILSRSGIAEITATREVVDRREKVREGMQRAAEVARECWNDPPCEADAEYIPNAILADMEKLK